jgi:hypothetical protein
VLVGVSSVGIATSSLLGRFSFWEDAAVVVLGGDIDWVCGREMGTGGCSAAKPSPPKPAPPISTSSITRLPGASPPPGERRGISKIKKCSKQEIKSQSGEPLYFAESNIKLPL